MPNTGNTQQIINYGATANDGTGDPLRTAFIKTDENFDNVWLAGPVGSNITIGNNTIQTNDTNGNIIIKPNGTGIIQANASIIPNSDNTRDLGSSARAWRRAYVDELLPETLTVSGDASIGGNLTVEGDTIQIGNITTDTLTVQLANTAGNKNAANGAGVTVGANDAIATFLFNSTSNTWVTNIGANITGNATASYFIGNGSLLTGLTSVGNSLVNGNSNVIVVNNGNVSMSANGTANILTVVASNIGWNSTQLAQVIVEGSLRATSGVRATSVDARSNIYSSVSDGTFRGGALFIDAVGNGNGTISAVTGSFSGNLNAGNIFVANNISVIENINGKTATFTGDATGDGSMYVGFPTFTNLGSDVIAQFSGNVNSYIQFNFQNGNSGPLASGDYVITANNGDDETFFFNMGLTSNNHSDPDFFGDTSTPNDAYIYVVGADATGPGDTGPGNLIIGSTNGVIKFFVGNTAQANVVQTISTTGVIMTGNIIPSANAIYSLGNATNYWSNLWVANNTIYIGGVPLGIAAGNVLTVGGNAVLSNNSNTTISTTGNITANYFLGNGSQLTGMASTGNYVFANNQMSIANTVMDIRATGAGSDIDIEAADAVFIEALAGEVDIRSADETFITTNSGGNIWTFAPNGELSAPGDISATGNVTANYFSGNGSQLTGLSTSSISNGTSNVTIPAANGNVTVTVAGTETWTFDTTGDLTVPGDIIGSTITSVDDISILGGDQAPGSASAEGGDIVINGGLGRIDNGVSTGSGGDVRMIGGDGGDAINSGSGTGGYVELEGGVGGTANSANSIQAGAGGDILIQGGGAGDNDSNLSLSGIGGNVEIYGGTGSFDVANSVPYGAPGHVNLYGGNWGWITQSGNIYLNTYDGSNFKTLTYDNQGNLTLPTNQSIIVDGGDGVIGPVSDDMVISWDNEEIILRSIAGGIEAQADADFRVKTGYNVGSGDYLYKWLFTNNNELVNITGDSTILTEAGNLNLQGGRNTLSSGNVQITAVDNGVAVNVWTFDNTGNLTLPGNITGNTSGFAIGYRDIPQVSFTGNATIATADAGKHFYSTQSTDYVLTIANNASQGFQTGAAITVINQGTGNITLAQGSGVTLYLTGNATSGNRTVTTFGMATLIKVATDTWFVSGAGVI